MLVSLSLRTHTHTHLRALCLGLSGSAGKVKPIWILLKHETVSGSGISWAICKSAPRSRQITMPAPHHSIFTGWMPFLSPSQQRQSTEGTVMLLSLSSIIWYRHMLRCKQAHLTMPCICGLTVSGWGLQKWRSSLLHGPVWLVNDFTFLLYATIFVCGHLLCQGPEAGAEGSASDWVSASQWSETGQAQGWKWTVCWKVFFHPPLSCWHFHFTV